MSSSLRRAAPMSSHTMTVAQRIVWAALVALGILGCSASHPTAAPNDAGRDANGFDAMIDGGSCATDPLTASCQYRGYGTTCPIACAFPTGCTFAVQVTWTGGHCCSPSTDSFFDCVCQDGVAMCRIPSPSGGRELPVTYCEFCGMPDAGPPDADIDASTDDADTDTTVVISELAVFGNCMPLVAPDPILASWTATVGGATGATATLTSATLTITGTSTVVQDLTVDVPVIALTDGAGSAEQRKVAAAMNPSMACGALCGASTARLDLTFLIDGASVSATADGTYGCAF